MGVKVLIVDTPGKVRTLLWQTLARADEVDLVMVSDTGSEAVECVAVMRPDVVVMDMEREGVGGVAALVGLSRRHGDIPIILLGTQNPRNAEAALECLALGGTDIAARPDLSLGRSVAGQYISRELLPRVLQLAGTGARAALQAEGGAAEEDLHAAPRLKVVPKAKRPPAVVDVVVVASSTGGPQALASLVASIPQDFPVPILLVQHLPATFTTSLARRLNSISPLVVREAEAGELIEAGTVYLAPGGLHMEVRQRAARPVVHIHSGEPVNFCRPAADLLFKSAVRFWGAGVLGVVMTGMGADSVDGCRSICSAGGHVIAQDEETSVVWGMPGLVAAAGLADQVIPVHDIGTAVNERCAHGGIARQIRRSSKQSKEPS